MIVGFNFQLDSDISVLSLPLVVLKLASGADRSEFEP